MWFVKWGTGHSRNWVLTASIMDSGTSFALCAKPTAGSWLLAQGALRNPVFGRQVTFTKAALMALPLRFWVFPRLTYNVQCLLCAQGKVRLNLPMLQKHHQLCFIPLMFLKGNILEFSEGRQQPQIQNDALPAFQIFPTTLNIFQNRDSCFDSEFCLPETLVSQQKITPEPWRHVQDV